MTIKWVKIDPLVMNGEPFCFGTRLSVRNLLEMRANGLTPSEMVAQSPELRLVGIADAFAFAAAHPERYGSFLEPDGSLAGPGFSAEEAADLPQHLRAMAGVVVTRGEPEPTPTYR